MSRRGQKSSFTAAFWHYSIEIILSYNHYIKLAKEFINYL